MSILRRFVSFMTSYSSPSNGAPRTSTENESPEKKLYDSLDEVQKAIYHRPFGPDGYPIDAWTDPYYETWFRAHQASEAQLQEQRDAQADLAIRPLFSIIVPLYKTPIEYFRTMADSVLAQTFDNFELVLINASPELLELADELRTYQERDRRITVVTLDENYGITENTNRGISVSKGDFCCFLDHDDFIEPNLLFEYASALNDDPTIDFLYCDEDMVSFDEKTQAFQHLNPMFKPQFSPELLLCKNYIIHLMTVRRTLIESMSRPDARYDGAQDYNMVLRCIGRARSVRCIEKVLYHWRIHPASTATNPDSKPYSRIANKLSVFSHIETRQLNAALVSSGIFNLHNVWFNGSVPTTSVVVSCADDFRVCRNFLISLLEANLPTSTDVIFVGNKPVLREALRSVSLDGFPIPASLTLISSQGNKLCDYNDGARHAKGKNLVFVDDLCSFITPEPLRQLGALCALNGVGISAPKLLYPNGSTKCFGVAVTERRIMPLHRGYPDDFPAYQCNARAFQNVSACSLQGLCISHDLFHVLGGFDERFEGEIGAADLCRRVLNHSLRIVATPLVKVEVDEAAPQTPYNTQTQAPDFRADDLKLFDEKWPAARAAGDPYYSSNFDQASPYCQLPRS